MRFGPGAFAGYCDQDLGEPGRYQWFQLGGPGPLARICSRCGACASAELCRTCMAADPQVRAARGACLRTLAGRRPDPIRPPHRIIRVPPDADAADVVA